MALGNQHSIKWVLMYIRQSSGKLRMFKRHGEWGESMQSNLFKKIVRRFKFPHTHFNVDFPHGGSTYKNHVAAVNDAVDSSFRKRWVVFQCPYEYMRVEKNIHF